MQPRWTDKEELEFIKAFSRGTSFEDLAVKHNRTASALELRLKKIIYDNVVRGKSASALSKHLNLEEERVKQYYYSYMDFREKSGKKVTKIELDNSMKTNQRAKTKTITKTITKSKPKSKPKTKSKGKKRGPSKKDKQITKLEHENKLLKLVIQNNTMKEFIKESYKSGKLDKKMMKMVKKMIKYGLF